MNRYTLDGANMVTREAAHDEISRALRMPAHYGRNLDALWDELTGLQGEITVLNAALLEGYGEQVLGTLREAAEENPRLTIDIQA